MRSLLEDEAHASFLSGRFYRGGLFNEPVTWREVIPHISPERAYEQLTKDWSRYAQDTSAQRFRGSLERLMASGEQKTGPSPLLIGAAGATALALGSYDIAEATSSFHQAAPAYAQLAGGVLESIVGAGMGLFALFSRKNESYSIAEQYLSEKLVDRAGKARVHGAARNAVLEKARTYEALEQRLHAGYAGASASEVIQELTGRRVTEKTARAYFTDLANSGHSIARGYLEGTFTEKTEKADQSTQKAAEETERPAEAEQPKRRKVRSKRRISPRFAPA